MFSSIQTTISKLLIRPQPWRQSLQYLHVTQVNPAARKGTREKARKKKVKVEIKKVGFIPQNKRKRHNIVFTDKHIDDSWKRLPIDNVYIGRYFQWRTYTVAEAIDCHRETHHPSMYDVPNAPVNVSIELNMQGDKPTRFVSNFQKLVMIDHPFDHGEERQIVVFAKEEQQQKDAQNAGATLTGGTNLIKSVQKGDVRLTDYNYVLAHPNIMPELISLRGLLRRKLPNPKSETLGTDLPLLVKRFLNGISYRTSKDESQENFGLIETCIGTLNMPTEHLISNFNAILTSVNAQRPKRDGKFITRVLFTSPPSQETLKINPSEFPFDNYDIKPVVKQQKQKQAIEDEPERLSEAN